MHCSPTRPAFRRESALSPRMIFVVVVCCLFRIRAVWLARRSAAVEAAPAHARDLRFRLCCISCIQARATRGAHGITGSSCATRLPARVRSAEQRWQQRRWLVVSSLHSPPAVSLVVGEQRRARPPTCRAEHQQRSRAQSRVSSQGDSSHVIDDPSPRFGLPLTLSNE